MADAPTSSPASSAIFPALVRQYGFRTALSLLPLLDPNAGTTSKAFAGASLAGSGAQAAGAAAGAPALATLGKGVSTGLGLAGTGYNLYNTITSDDLSKTQKVGHTGRSVADTIMSLVIPYYGLAKGVSVAGQAMEKSGSPQVRGLGRSLDYVAEPGGAKAFWDVAQGDMSPKAAFKKEGGLEGLMLDTMGPVGIILRGLGKHLPFLHSEPTTGTMFRGEISRLFDKIPELKGTDTSKYNIDPTYYQSLSPGARQWANDIAMKLTPLAGDSKKDPGAYQNQLSSILLNRFGNAVPNVKFS